jgi:penicillin-binding protein 1A
MRFETMEFGQGARSAMPIWGLFFKNLYANAALGYNQELMFERPGERLTIELDCSKYDKFGTDEDPFKSSKGYGEEEFEQ